MPNINRYNIHDYIGGLSDGGLADARKISLFDAAGLLVADTVEGAIAELALGGGGSFDPLNYALTDFGGFIQPSQGGFGFSIDSVDGDPAAALAALEGAPVGHGHRVDWLEVTTTTYTLSPTDEGKVLLFNVTGGAACTVTLPNQATQSGWVSGIVIGMMAYSAGTITIAPASSVNVDGVTATSFALVQHAMASITRMPASNYWNFSGQKA